MTWYPTFLLLSFSSKLHLKHRSHLSVCSHTEKSDSTQAAYPRREGKFLTDFARESIKYCHFSEQRFGSRVSQSLNINIVRISSVRVFVIFVVRVCICISFLFSCLPSRGIHGAHITFILRFLFSSCTAWILKKILPCILWKMAHTQKSYIERRKGPKTSGIETLG